jgi:phosphoribosylformylglycinamidine synthase
VAAALREDLLLFSESQSRLLVTVRPERRAELEALFAGQDWACLGEVTAGQELRIVGLAGEILVRSPIADLKAAWQAPLKEL